MEAQLIKGATYFYKLEAKRWLGLHGEDDPVSEVEYNPTLGPVYNYLKMIQRRLDQETDYCRRYHLPVQSTLIQFRKLTLERLLADHLPRVILEPRTGLAILAKENNYDGVRLLYTLTGSDIPNGHDLMARAFAKVIRDEGRATAEEFKTMHELSITSKSSGKGKDKAVEDGGASTQGATIALRWVENVLLLKQRYDSIWKHALNSDRFFQIRFDEVRYLHS